MSTIPKAEGAFCPEEIIESIPMIAMLDELETGHNTFSLLLLTPDGRVIYANSIAVNGFRGQTVKTVRGKWLHEFVPAEWLDERIQVMGRAVETGRSVIFIEIIEGIRLCSRIKSIVGEINGTPSPIILYTIEPIIASDMVWLRKRNAEFEIITANCIDLGILNILSDREIEVLALMGQGLRQKEIAKEICRSLSTVNRHRESIGEKLGVTDRAKLVRLANLACLEVGDATRRRITLNPDAPNYTYSAVSKPQ